MFRSDNVCLPAIVMNHPELATGTEVIMASATRCGDSMPRSLAQLDTSSVSRLLLLTSVDQKTLFLAFVMAAYTATRRSSRIAHLLRTVRSGRSCLGYICKYHPFCTASQVLGKPPSLACLSLMGGVATTGGAARPSGKTLPKPGAVQETQGLDSCLLSNAVGMKIWRCGFLVRGLAAPTVDSIQHPRHATGRSEGFYPACRS